MKDIRIFTRSSCLSLAGIALLAVLVFLMPAGCKQRGHTSDPRLRPIDEMLDAQLPAGATKARVTFYLSSQGFRLESTNDPHAIVATVHHVDTETLQPATAIVTFHFDTGDNLKSYELVAATGPGSQQ
jgi:hypothetical protein